MPDAADVRPGVEPVTRQYFKTYLQLIRNAVGAQLFRNFYVYTPELGEFDSLNDGEDSCAFFVSSILTLMKAGEGVHGTVAATVMDLETSGWQQIEDLEQAEPGDVLVWEPQEQGSEPHHHIGFAIGDSRAISNSSSQRCPAEHDILFGKEQRQVLAVYRYPRWDNPSSNLSTAATAGEAV